MKLRRIASAAIFFGAFGPASALTTEPTPIKHQIVFSFVPASDGKSVACSFSGARDVNYAKQEAHDTTFRPSAAFVEKACAKFLADGWHTWSKLNGKPDEDYCFWSEHSPNDPIFPVQVPE